MTRLTILVVSLLFGLSSQVPGQTPEMIDFLAAAYQAEDADDLAAVLAKRPDLLDETTIWREALTIGRTKLAEEAAGRAAIVRLIEAAVQRSVGRSSGTASLDRLDPASLEAMKAAVGFPSDDDLLYYLFDRQPSLTAEFAFERYSVVRMILPDHDAHLIRERTDRPYLGLSEAFSARLLKAENDPVIVAPGERAKTRHLNLAAVGDLVVAAKAYSASQRVAGDGRTYALIVAADAIDNVARANPEDFRLVPYRAQWEALRSLRRNADGDSVLEAELERREFAIARTSFFARQFPDALEAYRTTTIPTGDANGALWSA